MIKKTKKIVKEPIEEAQEIMETITEMYPLSVSFPNEDMNKVVEKINELVKSHNDSL